MRHSLRFDTSEFGVKVGNILSSLQIRTHKVELYTLAFIHRSVLNESSQWYIESNERLEFLGDAVLELVVTEKLFYDFAEKPEGELTDIRSALVRGRNLAEIAEKLGFSEAIQLSRGEFLAEGHTNPYILANTLEALLGAIYLDQGFDSAKAFIIQHIYSTLDHILTKGLYVDPKSYLQEITQWIWGLTPTYTVENEEWLDHNKSYHVIVSLDALVLGKWKWSSKKKAEQDAAENALSLREWWEKKVTLAKKIGL